MDRASSLTFPGGRTVAGWWRQLAPLKPSALWVGYGFLHRIEAPVEAVVEQPIDSLTHLLLQAIALGDAALGVSIADVKDRLHLPGGMVRTILAGLVDDGLLTHPVPDRWGLSALGAVALTARAFPIRRPVRRNFAFLEYLDPEGNRTGPPRYWPIAECPGATWTVGAAHRFDIANLQSCLDQPSSWKESLQFPLEVKAIPAGDAKESWRDVVLDRPERVLLALIETDTPNAGRQMVGFAVKADGWTLLDRAPVLRAPVGDWLTEMIQPHAALVWQDAWRTWCKQRQLPTNEVEICALHYHPPRLEIQAPPRLVQRLQAAKSDLFKGDAWVLVGDGYLRTAAQLAIKQSY